MPKYVKTIVKKSSVIPWIANGIMSLDSAELTEAEKQLMQDCKSEAENFVGYVSYNVLNVGNTQIASFEFDTIENLNNFIDKTQKPNSEIYDENSAVSKYNKLVIQKIKELGLTNAYQVSTSIETN